jgi:CheY-like chemotaxis protein
MPKKILLADDSITIQKVVELTFSEGDYQVFSVGNGTMALKKIGEVQPDVALLDVIMPEVNGYEVCEKVKRNPQTSWIPVLLLTGTFEPFDRKRADAAGANGHLTKPFESQMLISKVEELIASSRHPPVVAAERLGKMEIVAGGVTRREGEDPALLEARQRAESDPDAELTGESILPDRFDEMRPPAPAPEPEGIRTVRLSSDRILPVSSPVREEPVLASVPETSPETWDELAVDLGTASGPEPFREFPSPASSAPAPPSHGEAAAGEPPAPRPAAAQRVSEALPRTASPLADLPGALSASDVDRVADRVVERISEKVIREIAWEVIPELAETLIRRRIRELEEKISRES